MSCNECGGELVIAPIESIESGRYGIDWNKITISRPEQLEKKWKIMHKLYIDAFYSGSEGQYNDDTYREYAPEKNTEFESIMNYSYARPTITLNLCLQCGVTKVTTDINEIFDAIDVLTLWIEGEVDARKQKQDAKKKEIRDEKRKHYENQIAALQKKLEKLNDD